MAAEPRYERRSAGNWRLEVIPEKWSNELWEKILLAIERQLPSKHPRTLELRLPETEPGALLFVKIFSPVSPLGTLKDIFRRSKALRSLRQGMALSRAGFQVPETIAVGELRKCRLLQRAFVLTLGIDGKPAPVFLRDRCLPHFAGWSLSEKRSSLKRLAEEVRHLHELGFVHGDLVPSNILVSETPSGGVCFYFMDNDRTRRYPIWFPQTLWKRNLVQLNRFPLPGISLQDRMRFFCAYVSGLDRSKKNQRLLRWLEMKTRKRRRECNGADATVSFRKLMRWDGKIAEEI